MEWVYRIVALIVFLGVGITGLEAFYTGKDNPDLRFGLLFVVALCIMAKLHEVEGEVIRGHKIRDKDMNL